MAKRKKPLVFARKQPRQARAARLVADILEAVARVLAKSGRAAFQDGASGRTMSEDVLQ